MLPRAALDHANQVAERLRVSLASSPVKTSIGEMDVTVSLGVAEFNEGTRDLAALLERADQGLLTAKRQGRNQVVAIDK